MNTRFDVLVAGEINPDLIVSGDVEPAFGQVEKLVDEAVLTIGSSSVIFACGAARLGLKVAFMGRCGDDLFGHFILDEMQHSGIDTSHVIIVPGGSTGLSIILDRRIDRAILTYPGLIPTLQAKDLTDALLKQARHLHVASFFLQTNLQPDLHALFKRARSFGLSTSLDPNYDPSEGWRGVHDLLPVTNIFLPNEVEICSLTGTTTVEQAVSKLAEIIETLVVKQGTKGAMAVQAGTLVRVKALPVQVKDTVGAGDSFDAGFIYGYLNGWPLEKSLRLATVCGALSTRAVGGTRGQPTLAEALEWMEE